MVDKKLLHSSLLFSGMSEAELDGIAAACEAVSVAAGEYVYRKDGLGDYFYVVLSGEVELVAQRDVNSFCMVGRIGTGGHFGESSLLTGQPRSLSVKAVSDVLLGRFAAAFFQQTLLANKVFHGERYL